MKILITGVAGFVGSNLAKSLLKQSHQVIGLDNFQTGSKKNVLNLNEYDDFLFCEHDVCEPFDFKVDQIYNLACPASPPQYQNDPINTAKVCFLGTLHSLELAKKYDARVLQASTSEVYGNPKVHPQVEDYHGNVSTCGPRACYDEGKRIGETLFADFHRTFGTNVCIARIFNTYGPNMHPNDGRVVSNFIVQALANKPLTIYGSGMQTRSLQYVDDLVDGLIKLMNNADGFQGPVNLGNPEELTVKEIAELILTLIPDSTSNISYCPAAADDPELRRPDIQLAKKKLNWKPRVKIADGLERTIDFFASLQKNYS